MKKASIFLLVFYLVSCRDPYDPPVISSKTSFLVVEANLNPGPGPTLIMLGRTSGLETRQGVVRENNATVTVEGKDNTVRILTAMGRGAYRSANLNLVIGNEYRLRIKTNLGKEYVSAYIVARKTPAMDSIGWDREEKGLRIHANTKDLSGNSKYYRWDYDEAWEIRSYHPSTYIYENHRMRTRVFPAEDISVCWRYDTSTTILLANSTRLDKDIIHKAPLLLIPNGNDRLSVRYSIQVRQYALDRDAYNFFELIKKNTEEIGTIFAPQPSEVRGNVSSVSDRTEYVLGYVTCSTVEQQRVFIQIPWNYREYCEDVIVKDHPDSLEVAFGLGPYVPYTYYEPPPYYYGSTLSCVDCRARGGTLLRPSFW
jgi:hypothetical protein